MSRNIFAICVVLTAAGACLAQTGSSASALPPDPTSQTPEGKIVQEMFGKKIADAGTASGDDGVLAVTKQLLAAACDASTGMKLRVALATAALRLSAVVGTEDTSVLARKALDMAKSDGQMDASDKAFYVKEIASRRLAHARNERKNSDEMQALAKTAIETAMSYVEAAMTDDDSVAEVLSVLRQVRTWMNTYKLREYAASVDELENQNKAAVARRAHVKDALGRLESARKTKDPDAIKAASKAVAQIYMETEGDIRTAAKYYAGIEDPRGKAVVAAAEILDNPDPLDAKKALEAIEGLVRIIEPLKDTARTQASKSAMRLADLYLASNPPETSAAKVKLAMIQWQNAAGAADADKLKKELSTIYGPIQGKLEILDSDRISLTYDFSNPAQMKDWDTLSGNWDIGNGALGCMTAKEKNGAVMLRLPFRSDKPFKITFTAVAKHELTGKIAVSPWNKKNEPTLVFKVLGDGLKTYCPDGDWSNDKTHLNNKPCRIELVSEGDGKVAWSVNGTDVHTFKPGKDNLNRLKGSFQFILQTYDATSKKTFTLFDSVTVEGTILPNPDFIPDEYKKKKPDKTDDKGKSNQDNPDGG